MLDGLSKRVQERIGTGPETGLTNAPGEIEIVGCEVTGDDCIDIALTIEGDTLIGDLVVVVFVGALDGEFI